MEKQQGRFVLLKNRLKNWVGKWEEITNIFKNFMKYIKKDDKGQCIFELNEKKEKISMKFVINDESEEAFRNILDLIVRVIDGSGDSTSQPVIST